MRTAPDDVIAPVKSASMSAVVAISAFAMIPESPPIAMLKTFASAAASFVPSASTVTCVEPDTVPWSCALVAPETIAIGIITEIARPPTEPPGVVALAMFDASALTWT